MSNIDEAEGTIIKVGLYNMYRKYIWQYFAISLMIK